MIFRSGIEEPYGEREQLLQEVEDLRREYYSKNQSRILGAKARLKAAQNISERINEIEAQVCMCLVFSCATNFSFLNITFLSTWHYYSNNIYYS